MVGIDFFSTGKETIIKVVNLNDVTKNKELFGLLLNETFLAKPVAQFYFETIDEVKNPIGTAINSVYHYSFQVKQIIEVLKKSSKETIVWEKFNPELEIILIASACEIVESKETLVSSFVKKRRREIQSLFDPISGAGTGNYCPDCGGSCGNSKHSRRW